MTNTQRKTYDVIGFDLDGVLLDSVRKGHNDWKYRMLRKTLAHFGIPATRQNMEKIYMENLAKNIETFCRDFGIDKPCRLVCEMDVEATKAAFGMKGKILARLADGDCVCIFKYERPKK